MTAECAGCEVERLYDVGVSGLHRLFDHGEQIREAEVVIVVAGMEGALPSVVAGLVDHPVIAVPTSVGYGASFGGLAALLVDAQFLRGWDGRREHRQRLRRRRRRLTDPSPRRANGRTSGR